MDEALSGMVGVFVGLLFGVGDMLSGGEEGLLELAFGGDIQSLAVGDTVAITEAQTGIESALIILAQSDAVAYLHAYHRGVLVGQQWYACSKGDGKKTICCGGLLDDGSSGGRHYLGGGIECTDITHATAEEDTSP